MKKANRVLSFLLAFVLAFSMLGSFAYADPTEEAAQDVQSDSESAQTNGEGDLEGALDLSGMESFTVDAADYIEYIYLDKSLLTLGEEGFIAFGLLDDNAVIDSAELVVKNIDTEEVLSFESNAVSENSALFSFTFTEQSDAAAYIIVSLQYNLVSSDSTVRAVINREGVGSEEYRFEVITGEAEALLSSTETESDVSVFTITEDEEFVTVESVEEALETIDESVVGAASEDGLDAGSIQSLSTEITPSAVSSAREEYLVVALDPGHGGSDPGAIGYVQEANVNWQIALAMSAELKTYSGVSVVFTRGQNENPSLQQRVNNAVARGADVFISLHNNATGSGTGYGSEIWVPNNSGYYNSATHVVGSQLATKILAQLESLGLYNRGVKTRNYPFDSGDPEALYSDGSTADYYGVIRYSRQAGIPGIIVEHAFVDNASDGAKLTDPAFLTKLGIADATGVAQYYNLQKDTTTKSIASLQYQAHVSTLGWLSTVYDNKVAGISKSGFNLEAFNVSLINQSVTGDIQINAYVMGTSNWQGWKDGGTTAGTTGQSKAIQALQIRLTGQIANSYDVYYRTKVAGYGWLDWAKNGGSSGSIGFSRAIEGVQIILVASGTSAPGTAVLPFIDDTTSLLKYQAHSANLGWRPETISNTSNYAGTIGYSSSIEALTLAFSKPEYTGSITYNSYLANTAWQGWKSDGEVSGTTGQSKRMEAIAIKLTDELAQKYDIYYRAHVQSFGWLDWACNGAPAGSAGYAYRMEALQIMLVEKGDPAPGSTSSPYRTTGATTLPEDPPTQPVGTTLTYQSHVANIGWQNVVSEGSIAGTTGQSKAVEALKINISSEYSGTIEYNTHLAYIGWQGWKTNGTVSGTTGQSRRVEAIKIQLTGELATKYDIYYRVHAQSFGWLDWACNGASAGSAGYSYRMEAIQIKLVEKDGAAPGSTTTPFRDANASAIMGTSQTTVAQMVAYYNSTGRAYPSGVYTQYGADSITEWCTILLEEANAEGVRAEVVMCQAMKETGWLQFGGLVLAEQCNFCGLGATGTGVYGADFRPYGSDAVRTGLRAQVQHLKAYASTAPLNQTCVDPRFSLVTRGIAPTLEGLNGRWAVPGTTYGQDILAMINTLFKFPK